MRNRRIATITGSVEQRPIVIGGPGGGPRRARRALPPLLVAAGALVGLVAVLVVAGGEGTVGDPTTVTIPEGLADDLDPGATEALRLVRSFEEAFAAGDPDRAAGLVADAWYYLEVPGTARALRSFRPTGTPDAAIDFAVASAELDLGPCLGAPASTGRRAEYTVVCPEAIVGGRYPSALGRAGDGQRVVFGVAADRIVSIFWSAYADRGNRVDAYCGFALEDTAAAAAFDRQCLPVEDAGSVAIHRDLAGRYLRAGRPLPDDAAFAESLAFETVAGFFAAHDSGEGALRYLDGDFVVVRFPGLVVDVAAPPFPLMSEFLEWSEVVYRIDPGPCRRDSSDGGAFIRVDCPEATWSGPLVAALGLDPVVQPIGLLVDGAEITGIYGDTHPGLRAAILELCRRLGGRGEAAPLFDPGCRPVYAAAAARALLAAAS